MCARFRCLASGCILGFLFGADLYAGQPTDVKSDIPQADDEPRLKEPTNRTQGESSTGEVSGRDGWEFEFAPYLWASSLRTEVSAGPISADSDACFTDLLKDLDMGAMMRFEGRRAPWGFYVEGVLLDLSDDSQTKIGPFRVRGLETNVRFVQTELDFGGMYRLGDRKLSFDMMLGGRYTHLETDLSFGPFIDSKSNQDFVAPVIGSRVQIEITDKWLFSLKADAGGFGVGEAPDLTWGATAMIGYRMTQSATLGFGYRYYDMHNAQGDLSMDIRYHGPMVGVAFKF